MYLNEIILSKQREISELPDLQVIDLPLSEQNLLKIAQNSDFMIMGEIKSKSPSEGVIVENFNPVKIAQSYEKSGVNAISVLTDGPYFGGSFEILEQVSRAVSLPVMCKEFIIDAKQILYARNNGADACLLIVRILSDEQLVAFCELIEQLGMTALVEVFNETDTERALKTGAKLIGINNRNLDTLEMHTTNAARLKPLIPSSIPVLALSGVKTKLDIEALKAQFDGVLVGTALMRDSALLG